MAPIIEGPPEAGDPKPPLLKKLGWFALLWLASLAAVAAVAYSLRALIL
ncbi:MAG: DUF2474 family protein [Terricaulis sp.]|jgi:hypothetical protein